MKRQLDTAALATDFLVRGSLECMYELTRVKTKELDIDSMKQLNVIVKRDCTTPEPPPPPIPEATIIVQH